jgi:Uma2 family endonuclease
MTTAEYFETPETLLPRELAFGVLRAADAPCTAHQRVVGELFLALAPYVRERTLGEVLLAPIDVVLDVEAALVVQPDLVFVGAERAEIVGERVHGAPDLVVEVLSPRPRVGSIDERLGWFARYGVRECWLLSQPQRQLVSLELDAGGVSRRTVLRPLEAMSSGLLKGFRLPDWAGW